MAEVKNVSLYIVKSYIKKNNKLIPCIKFGYTKNINVRLEKFGNRYTLIKFYPAIYPEWRESYIKRFYFEDHFRISNNEHFEFESGLLKYMNEAILDLLDYKLKRNEYGFIHTTI